MDLIYPEYLLKWCALLDPRSIKLVQPYGALPSPIRFLAFLKNTLGITRGSSINKE
jgi:hypothetical protein